MNSKISKLVSSRLLLLAALPLAANQALAVEYWLQTGTAPAVMGVPMWGYALCGAGVTEPASCAGSVTVPGPALTVPPGESLIVHLKNNLPVPTSLIIPGQTKNAMAPVWFEPSALATIYTGARPAGNTTARVRSFDVEAPADGGSATYTWTTIKPGTYLYQSGTQPQVQVQMGLYGAMIKDAGIGKVAYSQGTTNVIYNKQVTLLYSEIDPALHAAVSNGTYGTTGPTSTLDYQPKYFLINGTPFPAASLSPVATVPAGQNTLLRLLNASLKTHVPTINGQYWKMIAEDGNPYPYLNNPRQQYTAFLAAGKTMDVLLAPNNASSTANARYAIFDSRQFDTNNGTQGGGLLAYLDVTPAVAAAPVFDSAPVTTGTPGVAYAYAAHATDPNGDVVSYSLNAGFPAGMSIVTSTGLINWPAANVIAGTYPVSVRASDTTMPVPLYSDQAYSLVIAGSPANHAPVAANDSYTAVAHPASSGLNQSVAAPGVLANDTDPDGNPLTAVNKTGSTRVTLNADGSFTLAPAGGGSGTTGTVNFTYRARDNSGAANNTSAAASVTINVIANRAPTAFADAFSVPRCTNRMGTTGTTCQTGTGFYVPLSLNLVSNDTDPDTQTIDVANQLPLAVARVRAQTSGSNGGSTSGTVATSIGGRVTIAGGSVISYVPPYNFAGTDVFQYRVKDKIGKESGSTATNNTNNLGQGWVTVTVTVQ